MTGWTHTTDARELIVVLREVTGDGGGGSVGGNGGDGGCFVPFAFTDRHIDKT